MDATDNDRPLLLHTGDIPLDVIRDICGSVVETVGERRSTWRRWNLMAEAARQTMGWRFATMSDRVSVIAMVTDAAQLVSLRLTPPELSLSPVAFRRDDGTSVFRQVNSEVFTSEDQLAAEDRLLERSRDLTGPTVSLTTVKGVIRKPDADGMLPGEDRADALTRIAVSGRARDVLIGPAGAGKTTAMNALRRAWEAEHGTSSAVGLAASAVAAQASPTIPGSRPRTPRCGGRTTSPKDSTSPPASWSSSTKHPWTAPCP
ncbi:AAA family ATPase [Gulosibacter bifidus]|nr:AAA family ATPase [Gulosibacter bifidus]